jgi:hypothetical protein
VVASLSLATCVFGQRGAGFRTMSELLPPEVRAAIEQQAREQAQQDIQRAYGSPPQGLGMPSPPKGFGVPPTQQGPAGGDPPARSAYGNKRPIPDPMSPHFWMQPGGGAPGARNPAAYEAEAARLREQAFAPPSCGCPETASVPELLHLMGRIVHQLNLRLSPPPPFQGGGFPGGMNPPSTVTGGGFPGGMNPSSPVRGDVNELFFQQQRQLFRQQQRDLQEDTETPDETPSGAGEETPSSAGKETPSGAGEETPSSAGKETPSGAGEETPSSAGKETPSGVSAGVEGLDLDFEEFEKEFKQVLMQALSGLTDPNTPEAQDLVKGFLRQELGRELSAIEAEEGASAPREGEDASRDEL